MKIIDLFSGIGGFSKGFQDAGFKFSEHYFSEIDKHCIANYKYNFKNAKYIGSVTDIPNGQYRDIDIITFGSPCQDFSLAGKRQGIEGGKSSLIWQAIRLIDDIRPSFFIWENVKGVFSSKGGSDFWAIVQAFANIGGYRLEWQLLNTKWFLPQNRERVYLIGHLATNRRDFRAVFPISENAGSITKKKKQTCINTPLIAKTLTGGGNSGGLHSDMTTIKVTTLRKLYDDKEFDQARCSRTLTSNYGHGTQFLQVKESLRRLTEIECERLQGFPDNWTKWGIYNGEIKEIAKTNRYKMLGNAVTVKVVEEIAKRIIL